MSLLSISEVPILRISFSTFNAMFSICSSDTGRFSHALMRPLISFSLLYSCLTPSFFTTISGNASTRSNVVKRNPHCSHSLRLRIEAPSSIGLESRTFVLLLLQLEHFIPSHSIQLVYRCPLFKFYNSTIILNNYFS